MMVAWEVWLQLVQQVSKETPQLLTVQETDRPGVGREWDIAASWQASPTPGWTRLRGRSLPRNTGALLPALEHTLRAAGLPVALLQGIDIDQDLALFAAPEHPGLLQMLANVELAWERSALALTVARTLAQFHALPLTHPPLEDETAWYTAVVENELTSITQQARASAADPLLGQAADWLEHHPPVPGPLALCVGDLVPDDLRFSDLDEVQALYGWERALVFDPAWDLASLIVGTGDTPLDAAARAHFTQVLIAAYAEHGRAVPQALDTFIVARLVTLLASRPDAPSQQRDVWRNQLAHALTRGPLSALS